MAGIGIIANPHSKLNKRNPRRQQLLSYIAGEQGRLEITNNLEELRKVAEEFRDRRIEILGINGGDGTISRTLTAFIHAYGEKAQELPEVAILRGGTINMLADNLGIRGTPEQVLYRLIEAHSAGEFAQRLTLNTLKIGDNYGFLFASGTSARFLEKFYEHKTGVLGSLWLFGKICLSYMVRGELFRKIVRNDMVVCLPGEGRASIQHESLSIFASTVERLPLRIRLFPEALAHNDKFQVVSVTMPVQQLVRRLPSAFLLQPHGSDPGKLRLATSALTLRYQGGLLYTLDGELYTCDTGELAIEMGPAIRFVVV